LLYAMFSASYACSRRRDRVVQDSNNDTYDPLAKGRPSFRGRVPPVPGELAA
jgi:hypothetical protein